MNNFINVVKNNFFTLLCIPCFILYFLFKGISVVINGMISTVVKCLLLPIYAGIGTIILTIIYGLVNKGSLEPILFYLKIVGFSIILQLLMSIVSSLIHAVLSKFEECIDIVYLGCYGLTNNLYQNAFTAWTNLFNNKNKVAFILCPFFVVFYIIEVVLVFLLKHSRIFFGLFGIIITFLVSNIVMIHTHNIDLFSNWKNIILSFNNNSVDALLILFIIGYIFLSLFISLGSVCIEWANEINEMFDVKNIFRKIKYSNKKTLNTDNKNKQKIDSYVQICMECSKIFKNINSLSQNIM